MDYISTIPTKLDRIHMTEKDWIKARTQELYDMLPLTTLEERNSYTWIRDEIIELNMGFFKYLAKNKYIADPYVTSEDKLNSAIVAFCQMWAKYKFTPKYRADLSFTVFFKPRISECIGRELNPIKYSLRRTICMKASEQLNNKPWGKLTKEDIKLVNLPPAEMKILEAIFNSKYSLDIDAPEHANISGGTYCINDTIDEIYTEEYDELEDLIVHEMIEQESKLSDEDLVKMSELYNIPYDDLIKARPVGEAKLQKQLEEALFISDTFESAVYVENDLNSISDIDD